MDSDSMPIHQNGRLTFYGNRNSQQVFIQSRHIGVLNFDEKENSFVFVSLADSVSALNSNIEQIAKERLRRLIFD